MPRLLGDLDLRVGVGAEGHQSVDLGRFDAGVTEGEVDRLDGQAELAAPRLLGELGGSDAHDGRVAGERMPVPAHRADPLAPDGTGRPARRTGREEQTDRSRDVVPEAVGPAHGDLDGSPAVVGNRFVPGRHRTGQPHGVVGVVGSAQADVDIGDHRAGPRPVGHIASDDPVGREDVHEDVLRPPLRGQHRVVVDVLVVAGGDGRGHDEGAGQGQGQLGQRIAHRDVLESERRRIGGAGDPCLRAHTATGLPARNSPISWRPSRASWPLGGPSCSSICLPHRK